MHRTTQQQNNTSKKQNNTNKFGRVRPCPVFASFTLAFALQLRKKHGKTSVRVAEEKFSVAEETVRVAEEKLSHSINSKCEIYGLCHYSIQ
jgi:hypothetical protein